LAQAKYAAIVPFVNGKCVESITSPIVLPFKITRDVNLGLKDADPNARVSVILAMKTTRPSENALRASRSSVQITYTAGNPRGRLSGHELIITSRK
jgi:hypothetical protein